MAETVTTPTLDIQVRYVTANERLLEKLARDIEHLTQERDSFTLTVVWDGSRFRIYIGQNAGII